MKIFDFSEKVGKHLSVFQFNFIMSKILNHQGNIHIGAMHLHENGIIGYPALTGSKNPASKFSESKQVRWGINCP